MITLGEHTLKRHCASWHTDPALTRRQAALLVKDVLATRSRLIQEAVVEKIGQDVPGMVEQRQDENGMVWVVFVRADSATDRGEALSVYTHPVTSVKGWHMIVEWHWAPVPNGRN